MKLQTKNFPMILAVVAMLAMSSLACSFSTFDFRSGNANVDLTLHEDEINHLLAESDNHSQDNDVLFKQVTSVDLSNDFVRVYGVYDTPNGKEATGSYDVDLRAENGELKAEIIGVDVKGASLSDPRIQHVNDELAESLSRSARESSGEVEFQSVEITDDALNMQVKVKWQSEDGENR